MISPDEDKAQLVEDVKSGGVLQEGGGNPYVLKDALSGSTQLPLQPLDQEELARIFAGADLGRRLRGRRHNPERRS